MTGQSPATTATFPARRLLRLAAVAGGVGLALAAASTVAHAPDWDLLALSVGLFGALVALGLHVLIGRRGRA